LVLLCSGCGDQRAAPVQAADDELIVSCGGDAAWAPATMARGIPGVLSDTEAKSAFQSILDDPRTGGEASMSLFPVGVDVEWRVLAKTGETLTVGLGEWTESGPVHNASVLSLNRDGDGWSTDGWGDCRLLAPVLADGRAWARVDGYRIVGPRSLEVDVSEVQCTSGRDPKKYLHDPNVIATGASVTLSWTSTPAEGAHSCQGNPSVTRTVELDEALGSRMVLDGSVYPPQPVPAVGWKTVEYQGVEVEIPAGWTKADMTGCEFKFERWTPPGMPACSPDGGVAFYGSATFDPAHGPGIRHGGLNDSPAWAGYVYAGHYAVYVAHDDRQLVQHVLGSARASDQ
jgi:hypothetical protein